MKKSTLNQVIKINNLSNLFSVLTVISFISIFVFIFINVAISFISIVLMSFFFLIGYDCENILTDKIYLVRKELNLSCLTTDKEILKKCIEVNKKLNK